MEVSTKELRIQPGKIIDQVVNGEEVTVTFRGKAMARIVPITGKESKSADDEEIFGMWSTHGEVGSVDQIVRSLREERKF